MTRRERVVELAEYLARYHEAIRPEEASAARVLRELVKNQRLGRACLFFVMDGGGL